MEETGWKDWTIGVLFVIVMSTGAWAWNSHENRFDRMDVYHDNEGEKVEEIRVEAATSKVLLKSISDDQKIIRAEIYKLTTRIDNLLERLASMEGASGTRGRR